MTTAREPERLLTEVELELMTILWRRGEGNVNDVLLALPPDRALAYTSVSTVLRILEKKKVVKTRKQGRVHVYVPLLDKAAYERLSLRTLITRVFDGAPSALVRCLVDSERISPGELRSIRQLLERKGAR